MQARVRDVIIENIGSYRLKGLFNSVGVSTKQLYIIGKLSFIYRWKAVFLYVKICEEAAKESSL